MFKLGIGTDPGISYKIYAFGVERSRSQGQKVQKHIESNQVASIYSLRVPTL